MSLLALLIIPLLAIVAILFRVPPKSAAVAAALLNLGITLGLCWSFDAKIPGVHNVFDIPWIRLADHLEIRFHLGLDGLNLPLILLTSIVSLAAVLITSDQIKRSNEFFIHLLIIMLGAHGAFLSHDLFFLYIFHEFALIPTFILIGIWGSQGRQFVSMQLTLYLTLGSLLLLAGLIALVYALPQATRSFDLTTLILLYRTQPVDVGMQTIALLLLLSGFGTLASLFPFHTWAAPGYATAPPAVAMLHAGVLKKIGVYGLIRIALPLLANVWHHPILIGSSIYVSIAQLLAVCVAANILYVGFVTIAQKDLSMMLGFSSVMHIGYMFLGLVAWNVVSISGVLFLLVAHGLTAALLFALCGQIRQKAGDTLFSALGGLASRAPFYSVLFIIASFSSAGLPGLANFPGELLVFIGSWKSAPVLTTIALFGVILTSIYQLRAVRRLCYGQTTSAISHIVSPTLLEKITLVLLCGSIMLLGFFPGSLLEKITPSVELILGANQ